VLLQKRSVNRYSIENEQASTSISAKKLKKRESMDFDVNTSFGYRLINFVSIFSTIMAQKLLKLQNIAPSIFNNGYINILHMIQVLNRVIGPTALQCVENLGSQRISIANIRAHEKTKEAKKLKMATHKYTEDIVKAAEDLLYGPGTAD
ncbi:hypothetical protein PV327_011172, partial [Microctonus hyperodae]